MVETDRGHQRLVDYDLQLQAGRSDLADAHDGAVQPAVPDAVEQVGGVLLGQRDLDLRVPVMEVSQDRRQVNIRRGDSAECGAPAQQPA